MKYSYNFPAVKGKQAKKTYYIAMVPVAILDKLFSNEDDYVQAEYRAQRRINENRIPKIKNYIINNMDSYVFSALTASISGGFCFSESNMDASIGVLKIDMDAAILINDGQHRKASLLEAVKEEKKLENETISVVFYEDQGLARSQQMFTDLNKHAIKTSNSLAELYDGRDSLAVLTRETISNIEILNLFTDLEKDILGKYSSNLFTLNTIYNANKRIIKSHAKDESTKEFIVEYWNTIAANVEEWNEIKNKSLKKIDARENYIVTQAVVIQAFGIVGNYFFENNFQLTKEQTLALRKIDWHRANNIWKKRAINAKGKIINSEKSIGLISNYIKNQLKIELTEKEKVRENEMECFK